tara:strand:+ start:88 stop:771 length:684 start_codon:yes stop_codon:yes gene_type:complete
MALTKITGEGVGAVDSITVTNGGSVQSRGGAVTTVIFDPRSNGAGMTGTTNAIMPTNQSGAIGDGTAVVDLGASGYRYRDVFLSGNIYLGGTGTANALNDYEEGTFTPTLAAGVSVSSYDIQRGSYTKIGNTVILAAQVEVNGSSRTGSQVSIGGLPFAAVNDGNKPTHGGYITYQSGFSSVVNQLFIGSSGNDLLSFHEIDGSSLIGSELSGASFEVRVVAIYKTS